VSSSEAPLGWEDEVPELVPPTVERVVKRAWALAAIGCRSNVEGDLALGDVPISKATDDVYRRCVSIAVERHQAANWLRGHDPVYSEVTTDT